MSDELLNRLTDELKEVKEKNIDLMNRNEDLRELMKSTVIVYELLTSALHSILEDYDEMKEEVNPNNILRARLNLPYADRDIRLIKKELEG